MSLKHGILGFLSEREMSGYDLEKRFKKSVGHFWNATISQIYRDLHSMEKVGWIKCREVAGKGKLNKKIYDITDIGYKELQSWLSNYTLKNDFEIRVGILMRMYFSMNIPVEETIKLLEQFRDGCIKELDYLCHTPDELVEYEGDYPSEVFYINTTISYGKRYYQMQIDWCNEIMEKIQSSNFLENN